MKNFSVWSRTRSRPKKCRLRNTAAAPTETAHKAPTSYKKAFAETALASKALTATAPSHSNIIQVKNNKSIL